MRRVVAVNGVEVVLMAKCIITSKVDSHHTNPNYSCLLINLLGDPTFHVEIDWKNRRIIKADWMPRNDAMIDANLKWMQVEPNAWYLLLNAVKPKESLHEVL